MDFSRNEEIKKYVETLKAEVRVLEACLQNGTRTEQLSRTSKRVVFSAVQLDQMISHPISESFWNESMPVG
jgi:hypothetical protein